MKKTENERENGNILLNKINYFFILHIITKFQPNRLSFKIIPPRGTSDPHLQVFQCSQAHNLLPTGSPLPIDKISLKTKISHFDHFR